MPTYAPSMVALQQRQKMADMLRQQSLNAPEGQMVSGRYVAPSWTQYAAQLLKGYMGGKIGDEASKGQSDLGKQLQSAKAESVNQMINTMPGTQYATTPDKAAAEAAQGEALFQGADVTQAQAPVGQTVMETRPNTEQDVTKWLLNAQQANPEGAGMAMKMYEMNQQRDAARQAKEAALTAALAQRDAATTEKKEATTQQQNFLRSMRDTAPVNNQIVQTDKGIVQVNPKTGQVKELGITAPAKAGATKDSPTQHIKDATESNALLNQVEKVGPLATGSGMGAARDWAGRLAGVSTEGAENAAKMKVLGASLTAKVPKMSGPQSDKDVAMYKEAAGNISDPMTPWPIKKAAISTIREINNRQLGYAQEGEATPKSSGGVKFLGFE